MGHAEQPAKGDGDRPAAHSGRFDFIDVLRAIAATSVVVQHVFELSDHPALRTVTGIFSPGVFGVALFFLVSGFVMPLSVRNGFSPVDFAIRRIFRIYPALLIAFALWSLISIIKLGADSVFHQATTFDWLANLLLIQDFVHAQVFIGVTWTLILEFSWYALFAISIMFFGKRASDLLSWSAPALILLITLISFVIGHRAPLGRIGMIYAAVTGMEACRFFMGDITRRRFLGDAFGFLAIMLVANLVSFGHFRHPTINVEDAVFPWIVAPVLFFLTMAPSIRNFWVFRSGVISWIGSLSFSVYLLHPLLIIVFGPPPLSIEKMVSIFLCTFLLSIISYYAIERTGIELGRRLSRKLGERRSARMISEEKLI